MSWLYIFHDDDNDPVIPLLSLAQRDWWRAHTERVEIEVKKTLLKRYPWYDFEFPVTYRSWLHSRGLALCCAPFLVHSKITPLLLLHWVNTYEPSGLLLLYSCWLLIEIIFPPFSSCIRFSKTLGFFNVPLVTVFRFSSRMNRKFEKRERKMEESLPVISLLSLCHILLPS